MPSFNPYYQLVHKCKLIPSLLWKSARIVPIGKIASPVEKGDFRPISILPALSKIFERLVANHVVNFIEATRLFSDTITRLRKDHSTGNALLKIRDDIKNAMKQWELSLLVFVDFSKAFDTIAHDTLIMKMHQQGFFKITSYLTFRKQFAQIDAS